MSTTLKLAKSFLGQEVHLIIDRPLGSTHPTAGFLYPVNYGFVPHTLAPDGEALDAYFLGVDVALQEALGRCIAIIHRRDDDDDKLVVVPNSLDLTDDDIRQYVHFQEQWFSSEVIR